jgi:CheY-like chemotaxis protein
MTDALNHIVLIEDNETTSFLNKPADGQAVPDLVFVDLKMPGMSGFDFLERYSQLPTEAQERTVVAVLTTSMHGADTARVAQYPNVEYLTKPLTEEKMQRLLAKRFAAAS